MAASRLGAYTGCCFLAAAAVGAGVAGVLLRMLLFSPSSLGGACRLRMMFSRPGSGLNLSGMLSQVRRPIMTAFRQLLLRVVEVRSLKYFMSRGSVPWGHGRPPSLPMPFC
jgi:hypothetical protein